MENFEINPNNVSLPLESENTEAQDVVDGNIPSCFRKEKKDRSENDYTLSKSKMYDEFYSMDFKYSGYLLIFAHSFFTVAGIDKRPKVEEDIKMLKESFSRLNFRVFVQLDRRLSEIKKILEEISSMNFDEYASFAIAISSHGFADGTIAALDAVYDMKEIIEPFKNTASLFNKPKMFFFGCCRGKLVDNGVTVLSSIETDGSQLEEYKIPSEADILIVYATVEGYMSFHNDKYGTQFFIYLTEALDDFAATKDLMTVITLANQQLSIFFSSSSSNLEYDKKKQCACIMSTLTRRIKFKLGASTDKNMLKLLQ